MPRANPVAAGAQHLTKAEKEERLEREKAIRLGTDGIYPPAWLGETATFIFRRIADEGAKIGLFDNLDNDALARYADLSSKLIGLKNRLDAEGIIIPGLKGGKHINPTYEAYLKCQEAIRKQSAALGLTSIERLKLATAKQDDKQENKFMAALKAAE